MPANVFSHWGNRKLNVLTDYCLCSLWNHNSSLLWITVKMKNKIRSLDNMKLTSANNWLLTLANLAIVLTRLTNYHHWNHQRSYSLWLIRLTNDTIYWLTYQMSDWLRVDWPLRPQCSDGCYSALYTAEESRNMFTSPHVFVNNKKPLKKRGGFSSASSSAVSPGSLITHTQYVYDEVVKTWK